MDGNNRQFLVKSEPHPGVSQTYNRAIRPPAPGQQAMTLAGLLVGVLLMGIQLWLLTIALDLYLAGEGSQVWTLSVVSGLIFLGGIAMLLILRRQRRRLTR